MPRTRVILSALAGGLVAGAAAWLIFSHGASAAVKIADLKDRADALVEPGHGQVPAGAPGAIALSAPIFALTTGPNAVQDTTVSLVGLVKTPSRTAALLAIDGKPAEWIDVGQTKDDVTLDDVQADRVTVDTPIGAKEVQLGQTSAASSSPAPQPTKPPPDASQSGFRLPPPPASAPHS